MINIAINCLLNVRINRTYRNDERNFHKAIARIRDISDREDHRFTVLSAECNLSLSRKLRHVPRNARSQTKENYFRVYGM